MHVKVNQVGCISCGSCESLCPKVFKLNSRTGKSEVINEKGDCDEAIMQAAQACPVQVISVSSDSGEKLWPKK